MTDRKTTCGHPTRGGGPCPVDFGLCPACGECFQHCDHRAEERKAGRAKGGDAAKAKSAAKHARDKFAPAEDPPAAPTNAAEARDYLSWLLSAGTRGDMGSARARDMATIAKLYIDAVKVAGLEARIKGLEATLAEMRGAGK
jgi:hypothetical protein